jgi:hypothetical protein
MLEQSVALMQVMLSPPSPPLPELEPLLVPELVPELLPPELVEPASSPEPVVAGVLLLLHAAAAATAKEPARATNIIFFIGNEPPRT